MSLTIQDLRAVREVPDPDGELSDLLAELEDNSALVGVSESEVIGLAVELLKQRGAEEVTLFGPLLVPARFDPQFDLTFDPGRYLVVPWDALEGSETP